MVNFLYLDNSIIVNFKGETHTIRKGDAKFTMVEELIVSGELEKIPDVLTFKSTFDHIEGMELKDNCVFIDGEALPEILNLRVLQYMEKRIPFDSLIRFARKLRKNPSLNSRKMLYKFLEHNGHPITEEGNFIAYRGVTNDFKDRHTGKFDNSVGAVCEMPRSQVDDNPNNTCSEGLHVACYDYAYGFGPKRIEVEVNPVDVVCVPADYDGTKMRVCKFRVVAEAESLRDEPYYTGDVDCCDDICEDCEEYENNCECY